MSMTPRQLTEALRRLGLSQVAAARLLGVSARTVRYWIAGTYPIPEAVSLLLRTWLDDQRHKRRSGRGL